MHGIIENEESTYMSVLESMLGVNWCIEAGLTQMKVCTWTASNIENNTSQNYIGLDVVVLFF